MSAEWPGDWESKTPEPSEPGFTNDHGTLYMIDSEGDGWLWMDEIPAHLENRC
jgi:hypothetical protein